VSARVGTTAHRADWKALLEASIWNSCAIRYG
jgi:hypothetical protein